MEYKHEQFTLEGVPPKSQELEAIDTALRDATAEMSTANHHYFELIAARIALREVLRREGIE